jgi:tetratricopeptide (TPR) repeat protein
VNILGKTLCASIILLTASSCSLSSSASSVDHAEELVADGRYEEAIEMYSNHIEERLAEPSKPEWENPYFYLLAIGDIQLRMGQPTQALASFNEAEQHKVEQPLIADRYRSVAIWYEEHEQLDKAFEVLKTYRDRDSLIFDTMLDRLARRLTAQEAQTATKQKCSKVAKVGCSR